MTEIAIAIFKPRPGRVEQFTGLLRRHVGTLREEGLATDRPALILRSREDGTFLEIFEWKSAAAVESAHTNPRVTEIWKAMNDSAEFSSLSQLIEADRRFPHFDRVEFSEV